MFSSLYSKLAAVLTVLFALVGLVFLIVVFYSTNMYQQEVNQKLNSNLAEQIVKERLLITNQEVNHSALKDIFHMLMVINPSIEIYLLDIRGNILAYSAPHGAVKRDRVDLRPIKKCLEGHATFPILGDDPRSLDGRKVFSVARIPLEGVLQGYLYVILGGETYDNIAQKLNRSHILKLSTWMIGASIVFALITGLFLFASLTGRLKKLANLMDAFKGGDGLENLNLQSLRSEKPVDEIERMGAAFAQMAERIEQQVEKLVKVDASRRDLIANVSHDLRTPLATLQGYIETLLMKDQDLDKAERKKYLEIAIRHCEHLSNLVDRLMELASLESPGMKVNAEPFSIGELIQDLIQKFQLKAKEKQIRFTSNAEDQLPFVNGDIGLIERALENLIENALRHTPDSGEIKLILTPQPDGIRVEVSDTGPGIPHEELSLVFKRFHQLDKSRNVKTGHTGLGLAITKKIVELHESSIEVASTLGAGTSFSFLLPT